MKGGKKKRGGGTHLLNGLKTKDFDQLSRPRGKREEGVHICLGRKKGEGKIATPCLTHTKREYAYVSLEKREELSPIKCLKN